MDLLVALGEFSGYVIQERTDLIFRKGHDPGDNSARSLGILVPERTEKNSGLVRTEDRGRALDAYRGGGDHGLVNLEKTSPEARNYFQRESFFRVLPGTLRSRSVASNRLEESNGENEYRLARPCGCQVYVLVPISHAATPTNRGAYCFFLNVGN